MRKPGNIFDGLLVLQAQSGDKKALSLLVRRWHPKMYRQAYWYTKDPDKAKDIVQDSWSVILKKIYKLNNTNSFGSWVLTIVNRRAIDAIRSSKRINEKLHTYYEHSKLNYDNNKDNFETNADRTTLADDHSKVIVNAIRSLPDNQELIIRMFYL